MQENEDHLQTCSLPSHTSALLRWSTSTTTRFAFAVDCDCNIAFDFSTVTLCLKNPWVHDLLLQYQPRASHDAMLHKLDIPELGIDEPLAMEAAATSGSLAGGPIEQCLFTSSNGEVSQYRTSDNPNSAF
jgi:hypothetical protein